SRRGFGLELARAEGAECFQLNGDNNIVERILASTNNQGCTCVIEAVGEQVALDLATELTCIRGRLVIAGYHQDGPRQVNMQQWNWLGIDVINAHERSPRQYVRGMIEGMDAIVAGTLNLDLLLTHTYALDELGRAIDDVAARPDG